MKEEKVTISPDTRDEYQRGTYEVKAVCPLLDDPFMLTYHFTQEEFDEYLSDYPDYGEFIVSVRRE